MIRDLLVAEGVMQDSDEPPVWWLIFKTSVWSFVVAQLLVAPFVVSMGGARYALPAMAVIAMGSLGGPFTTVFDSTLGGTQDLLGLGLAAAGLVAVFTSARQYREDRTPGRWSALAFLTVLTSLLWQAIGFMALANMIASAC